MTYPANEEREPLSQPGLFRTILGNLVHLYRKVPPGKVLVIFDALTHEFVDLQTKARLSQLHEYVFGEIDCDPVRLSGVVATRTNHRFAVRAQYEALVQFEPQRLTPFSKGNTVRRLVTVGTGFLASSIIEREIGSAVMESDVLHLPEHATRQRLTRAIRQRVVTVMGNFALSLLLLRIVDIEIPQEIQERLLRRHTHETDMEALDREAALHARQTLAQTEIEVARKRMLADLDLAYKRAEMEMIGQIGQVAFERTIQLEITRALGRPASIGQQLLWQLAQRKPLVGVAAATGSADLPSGQDSDSATPAPSQAPDTPSGPYPSPNGQGHGRNGNSNGNGHGRQQSPPPPVLNPRLLRERNRP